MIHNYIIKHFNSDSHSLDDFRFVPIDVVNNEMDRPCKETYCVDLDGPGHACKLLSLYNDLDKLKTHITSVQMTLCIQKA